MDLMQSIAFNGALDGYLVSITVGSHISYRDVIPLTLRPLLEANG